MLELEGEMTAVAAILSLVVSLQRACHIIPLLFTSEKKSEALPQSKTVEGMNEGLMNHKQNVESQNKERRFHRV